MMVISFFGGASDSAASGVQRVAPHAKTISLQTNASMTGHVTTSLVDQLRQIQPPFATAMEQMLRSIESRGVGYTTSPSKRIVIHPGAGKEANRWPVKHFINLVEMLRDSGKEVRILLGEAELERFEPAAIDEFRQLADVAMPATLVDLLNELSAAAAFFGNDSGPTHLAGIIGVPTVCVFGPNSDLHRWRPLGPKVRVLSAESLEAIEPGSVYTELSA